MLFKRAGLFCGHLVLVCLAVPFSVFSAGFSVPESSIEGIALSDALVANSALSGAFTYNYSSMLFAETDQFSIDLIGVSLDSSVSPSPPNDTAGRVNNQARDAALPSIYITQKISQEYAWGLHLGVPFGLETVWPASTFSHFQSVDSLLAAGGAVAGLHPAKSSLELVALSPSVGKKISDEFALAIGLDYYRVINVEVNSTANQLSGNGDEFGWNLSMQYHKGDFSAGLSYHSAVDIRIDGNADIGGLGVVSALTQLPLPDRLQLGVAYQWSEKLTTEFDIERVGWSEYDQLVLTSTGGAIPAGTVFSTTRNHWRDVTNYRLGVILQLDNKTKLLLGAGYEQKAQGDNYFDATIADTDRYMLSAGGVYNAANNWQIKAAYQYAWMDDRRVNGRDYASQLVTSGGLDTDPNGSDVYNGKYTGHIQMLGIGVSKLFY